MATTKKKHIHTESQTRIKLIETKQKYKINQHQALENARVRETLAFNPIDECYTTIGQPYSMKIETCVTVERKTRTKPKPIQVHAVKPERRYRMLQQLQQAHPKKKKEKKNKIKFKETILLYAT